MKKKGMKPLGISLVTLIIVAIGIVGIIALSHKPTATSNAIVSGNNSGMQKLSDSPYASYAYLISTDTLSLDTKQAISGFQINKVMNSDGTTTYNLIALNSEYQNQSYTLQSGQSLYFIERSMGDDGNGSENFLGDDHAVIVDSSGYIIQGPTSFS
jgi:hypothetical protein